MTSYLSCGHGGTVTLRWHLPSSTQQLGTCHAAADGSRHDVLMAVITLWIATADRGHNQTIVAAILEKALNRGDMLSEGSTPVLHLIIKPEGTHSLARQWQAQTRKEKKKIKHPAPRSPSMLIEGRGGSVGFMAGGFGTNSCECVFPVFRPPTLPLELQGQRPCFHEIWLLPVFMNRSLRAGVDITTVKH